ncbi:hypothetical protein ABZZ79_20245 [Streptomyces sp. NPDC006458]|uniref:hypothetical protein n=1 Tax=Streptomyces sp. NPDC006458 TaxID=3154302 RepID=UPI0033BDEFCB
MTTPDPGVYISPAQMYQEVRGLAAAVGRIETKIDGILNETKDIRTDLADHETRLRALENMPKSTDIEPRVTTPEEGPVAAAGLSLRSPRSLRLLWRSTRRSPDEPRRPLSRCGAGGGVSSSL